MDYSPGSYKELDMTEQLTHTHTHTHAHNDPATPLLDIYPAKTIIGKDTCTPVFIEALFTIAKTWKPPKCPLTDEWIEKTIDKVYSGILLSHKKNKIMPFAATWMDLEILILSEVSQRKTNMISLICEI